MAESLGQSIVNARREKSYTLRYVAGELKISPALLSMIERNAHKPKRELLAELAKFLDADIHDWASLMGRISMDAESSFSKLAREKPEIYRMLRTFAKEQGGSKWNELYVKRNN